MAPLTLNLGTTRWCQVECRAGGDGDGDGGGVGGNNNEPKLLNFKACAEVLAKQKASTSAIYILESPRLRFKPDPEVRSSGRIKMSSI